MALGVLLNGHCPGTPPLAGASPSYRARILLLPRWLRHTISATWPHGASRLWAVNAMAKNCPHCRRVSDATALSIGIAVLPFVIVGVIIAAAGTARSAQPPPTLSWWVVLYGALAIVLAVVIGEVLLVARAARDAHDRGWTYSSVTELYQRILLWNWVWLLYYRANRPAGDLVQCGSCSRKRLPGAAACPHCGSEPLHRQN
jgi:hypothetical protein